MLINFDGIVIMLIFICFAMCLYYLSLLLMVFIFKELVSACLCPFLRPPQRHWSFSSAISRHLLGLGGGGWVVGAGWGRPDNFSLNVLMKVLINDRLMMDLDGMALQSTPSSGQSVNCLLQAGEGGGGGGEGEEKGNILKNLVINGNWSNRTSFLSYSQQIQQSSCNWIN